MANKFAIFLLLAAAALCCCTPQRVADSLRAADEMMETRPDSSLVLLCGIDTSLLRTPADRALYALLLTQAGFKNGQFPDTTALIDVAVDYYASHGSDFNRMRSLFYQSRILCDQGNLTKSMPLALRAYELANALRKPYWVAKSSELIADAYARSYNFSMAQKRYEEAAAKYLEGGREDNHRFSLCDVGLMIGNAGDEARGIELIDSIREIALRQQPADSMLVRYCDKAIIPLLIYSEQEGKGMEYFEELVDYSVNLGVVDYLNLAQIYAGLGEIGNAREVLSEIEPYATSTNQRSNILIAKAKIYEQLGDERQTRLLDDSIIALQNDEVTNILKQSVTAAQSDYYQGKAIHDANMLNKQKNVFYAALIIFVAMLLAGFVIYKYKMRVTKLEHDHIVANAELLKSQIEKFVMQNNDMTVIIDSQKEELSGLNSIAENAIQQRFDTLDKLCSEYHALGNSGRLKSSIFQKIQDEINALKSDEGIAEIVSIVDEGMSGIISKIKAECPEVTRKELVLASYMLCGLSPNAIAHLLGARTENVYNIKSRLASHIANSASPHKEWILGKLKWK